MKEISLLLLWLWLGHFWCTKKYKEEITGGEWLIGWWNLSKMRTCNLTNFSKLVAERIHIRLRMQGIKTLLWDVYIVCVIFMYNILRAIWLLLLNRRMSVFPFSIIIPMRIIRIVRYGVDILILNEPNRYSNTVFWSENTIKEGKITGWTPIPIRNSQILHNFSTSIRLGVCFRLFWEWQHFYS